MRLAENGRGIYVSRPYFTHLKLNCLDCFNLFLGILTTGLTDLYHNNSI